MLIALSGLPGVGKTTIARGLALSMGAVHLRIDTIEEALRAGGAPIEDGGYRVAYGVAGDNLRLGRTVVADCVNPWPVTRDAWRSVAEHAGVRVLEVEVVCADAAEHRRRVEARAADRSGQALPAWTDVVARDYRPWTRSRLVVDARRDIVDCVGRIHFAATGIAPR